MSTVTEPRGAFGLMAEFTGEHDLVEAARRAREAGYTHLDAYTPYPVEDLPAALDLPRSKVPLIVLIGGILGGLGGLGLQWWVNVIRYPMNIGGRPYASWPSFIVVTFECTILLAALSGVVGMILLNKLPQPYHPAFNWDRFLHASRDRFFLCVEADDPQYERDRTAAFLRDLGASAVQEVEQ